MGQSSTPGLHRAPPRSRGPTGPPANPEATGNLISSFSSWGHDRPIEAQAGPRCAWRLDSLDDTARERRIREHQRHLDVVALRGRRHRPSEARPRTKPADVLRRPQNNAKPRLWSGNPALGVLTADRQGAGMLAIAQAIVADTEVTPSRLACPLENSNPPRPSRRLHVKKVPRHHRGRHKHGRRRHDDGSLHLLRRTRSDTSRRRPRQPAPSPRPRSRHMRRSRSRRRRSAWGAVRGLLAPEPGRMGRRRR